MKRLLRIITITIIAVQSLIAQDAKEKNEKKFNYGILTSINLYNFEDANTIGIENTNISEYTSTNIGGFVEMSLSDKFTLRGELLYANGANSNFIEVPFILRYKLCDKIYFYSGVQLNYMLGKRGGYFDKIGLGFNVGIEYNFTENWFLDLRYVHKDSQQIIFDDFPAQVQSIRLGVGYRF
jgi:opacity protein-like surface antigen